MSKDRISEAVDKLVNEGGDESPTQSSRPRIDQKTFNAIRNVFNRTGLTVGEEKTLSPSQIDRMNDLLRTIHSYAGIVSDILDEAEGTVSFH